MDSNNKSSLRDKYWKAESSLEEEKLLKERLAKLEDTLSPKEVRYFKQIKQFSDLELEATFEQDLLAKMEQPKTTSIRRLLYLNASKIAASLLLVMACMTGFSYWSAQERAKNLAAQEAFETATQSLLLMSAKLNKGTTTTYQLTKFSATQQKIKSD